VQVHGRRRHVSNQVHARLELIADGRNDNRLHDLALRVHEHRADEVRARNAREADPPVTLHAHLAHAVGRVIGIGVLQRFLAAHDFLARNIAALRAPDVLKAHHRRLRACRLVCGIIAAVAAVVLAAEVVIDTLAPEERLIHHPVALRTVQLCLRAVGILVAVSVVKGIVGHLAVRVVHRHLLPGHVHVARARFPRHLRQHPVPPFQDGRDVAAGHIGRAALIAGPVVEVRHVRVVRHRVVERYHRVVRLPDVQFRELLLHRRVLFIFHVRRQAHRAHQGAVVHRVALGVHALQCLEPAQQRAVILCVDTLDADALHAHAPAEDRLPVQVRAGREAQRPHRAPVLQRQPAVPQFRQVLQPERLYAAAQFHRLYRCTRSKQHRLHIDSPRVQRPEPRLRREVQFLARQRARPRTLLPVQVDVRQFAALVKYQAPPRGAAARRLKVEPPQGLALVQVHVARQVVRSSAHVQLRDAARAVDADRVVHGEGAREGQRYLAALLSPPACLQVRGVVRAVAEVVQVARRHRDGIGRGVRRAAHVHVDVVRQEVARPVLRVEQREAVPDEPVAECLLVALQRIDVGVFHQFALHHHALCLGLDVLQLAALVVGTSAPVALLLPVEHLAGTLLRQVGAHLPGHRHDLLLQVSQHQAPQPRVVPLEGILRLLRVPGLPRHVVEVGQHGVVAVANLRVAVVVDDVPQQQVPCRPYHVLGALVHVGEEVREEPPAQQEVPVDVLSEFALELGRDEGAHVGRCRTLRHAVPYPAPQALEGCLLLLRRGGPCHVFRIVELQRVVELHGCLRVKVRLPLEQAQGLRVVQELEGDRLLRVKSLHAFQADDLVPVALVVVQVVLPVVGRRVLHALGREHVDGEAVDGRAHAAVRLLCGGEEAQRLHHVVPQFRAARVLGH